jgi:hypothetical protein
MEWDIPEVEPPEPTRFGEVVWLEPFPDALLKGAIDVPPLGPEARYELTEANSLAFVTHRCCAAIVQEPATHFFGERQYVVRDLTGRAWCFSESVEDKAPEDWGAVGAPGLRLNPAV